MAAPRHKQCYFVITPSIADSRTGLLNVGGQPGPGFYIKFGDGNWHNHSYTRTNPSFEPGENASCAKNLKDQPKFYDPMIPGAPAVNAGKYLETKILKRLNLIQVATTEWYAVRPGNPLLIVQLGIALKAISDDLAARPDLGYNAALNAFNAGQDFAAQRAAATAVMAPIAATWLARLNAEGAH